MRILIYGINFTPELTGIGKYSGEMAKWLAMQGHKVRVVTAPPYYPQWYIANGFPNRWARKLEQAECVMEEGGFLAIYRCPLWVPAKLSGLKRILHLATFALSSFPVMLWQIFWRPDVVWVVEPALFCAPTAWLTARLSGAKAWLHVQDFEVDAAFEMGIVKAGWLKRFVLVWESWLMGRFDRVSTISSGMLAKLSAKGMPVEKVVLFPNWADVGAIFPDAAAGLVMRAELGLAASMKVVLYSGNMGEKQGLEYVVEAARLLIDEPDLVFVLCGDGTARGRLQAAAHDLSNIRWLPLQSMEKLNALLNMADVHLLPQRKDAADLVMPSKLTGIFASGRPVIAMAEPGTTLYEAVSDRGVVVAPEDVQALADAILRFLANSEECSRLGAAGRQFAVDTLGKDIILQEFEKKLLEL